MTRSMTVRRVLVVEACDLDTDARSRREFEVDAPTTEPEQRAQLADVVARMHPSARMRSFGSGAASFLDRERLIVAHYAAVPSEHPVERSAADCGEDRRSTASGEDQQQPLFAA